MCTSLCVYIALCVNLSTSISPGANWVIPILFSSTILMKININENIFIQWKLTIYIQVNVITISIMLIIVDALTIINTQETFF